MEQPPSISDLPLEITTHILENLEPWDFVRCQRVCKGFKEVVDHHFALQKKWNFLCENDDETKVCRSYLTNFYSCVYYESDSGCEAVLSIYDQDSHKKIERTFKDKDPSEMAIEHFGVVARNPVVRLDKCYFRLDAAREELFFEKIFDGMDHKLYTKEFEFYETPLSIVRRVLAHLQPGFLEKLCITHPPEGKEDEKIAKEIAEMDHWKLAKNLSSGGWDTASWLPIDDLLHADQFYINLSELAVQDLIRVKERLFSSTNFKEAWIRCCEELSIDEFAAGLGPPIIKDEDSPDCISYKIPGTEEYLDFEFKNKRIEIKRY